MKYTLTSPRFPAKSIVTSTLLKIIVIVFVTKVPLLITVLRTRWCKAREALVNKTRLKRVKVSTRLESALKIIDTI